MKTHLNEAYRTCKLLEKTKGWEIWPRVHKEKISATVWRIIMERKDAELKKPGPF
jgi:hypothetical protein